MIPDRDYYADKDGKLTTDASRSAFQVAVKGVFLDERVARRYGITDTLVSIDEPNAPLTRVVKIETEPEEKELEEQSELEEKQEEPQKPAVTAGEPEEVEAEKSKASVTVKRSVAKKGEKKK